MYILLIILLNYAIIDQTKSSASSTSTGESSHSGSSKAKETVKAKESEKRTSQNLTFIVYIKYLVVVFACDLRNQYFQFDPPSEVIDELLDEAEEEVKDRQEQFRRKMERNPDADPNKVAAELKHGYTVKEFTAKLLRAGYTSEQLAA